MSVCLALNAAEVQYNAAAAATCRLITTGKTQRAPSVQSGPTVRGPTYLLVSYRARSTKHIEIDCVRPSVCLSRLFSLSLFNHSTFHLNRLHIWGKKKEKGSPYSVTEHRVSELIPVLSSQHAGDVSHEPDGRLPLLSARPAVTPATLKSVATNFAAL